MTLPIATTTIKVLRVTPDASRDPYEEQPAPATIARGIRAVISTSRGTEAVAGGSQEVVSFRLDSDPTDITHLDQIEDEATGDIYEVVWARQRVGFGLEHTQAGLRQVTGLVSQRVPL